MNPPVEAGVAYEFFDLPAQRAVTGEDKVHIRPPPRNLDRDFSPQEGLLFSGHPHDRAQNQSIWRKAEASSGIGIHPGASGKRLEIDTVVNYPDIQRPSMQPI